MSGPITSAPPHGNKPSEQEAHAAALPDADLVSRARRGDFSAFETLVRRHHRPIFRLVMSVVRDLHEAEEVVQETFLTIFRRLADVRDDIAIRAWMYRLAINHSLMRLRESRRRPVLALDGESLDLANESGVWAQGSSLFGEEPDQAAMRGEVGAMLTHALGRLPEKYRMVLWLRDVMDQSNEEVANVLGLTLPTVKARLHRARLWLRQALGRRNVRPGEVMQQLINKHVSC